MIYDTKTWEYPYLYNLIDQYRDLAKYNNGYSYNMMFVGPGWMNKMGRWEQPYELLLKSYTDGCNYYGKLKKEGKLIDMTMSEFADYYREKKGVNAGNYNEPECAPWRDILYGSDKQLFWYCDPYMRACVNMDQGGAIVDLRPYVAKLEWPVGIGTKHVQDASYPFLIQEKYRAGYFTHYAGAGTVRSAKLSHNGEEVDLCLCPTHSHFSEEVSDPNAEVYLDEYITACYGTTEYPEDMTGSTLTCEGENSQSINYEYKCRDAKLDGATAVSAVIPAIQTKVSLTPSAKAEGYIEEGYAFSPMFKLGYKKQIKDKEVFATWLNLEKAN